MHANCSPTCRITAAGHPSSSPSSLGGANGGLQIRWPETFANQIITRKVFFILVRSLAIVSRSSDKCWAQVAVAFLHQFVIRQQRIRLRGTFFFFFSFRALQLWMHILRGSVSWQINRPQKYFAETSEPETPEVQPSFGGGVVSGWFRSFSLAWVSEILGTKFLREFRERFWEGSS